MKEYKRLTIRLANKEIGCLREYRKDDLIRRLAELEDKIENGTLIFIDEPFYSECNNCWAVFQRTDDNVITCEMTEQQAKNYKKFIGIEK